MTSPLAIVRFFAGGGVFFIFIFYFSNGKPVHFSKVPALILLNFTVKKQKTKKNAQHYLVPPPFFFYLNLNAAIKT